MEIPIWWTLWNSRFWISDIVKWQIIHAQNLGNMKNKNWPSFQCWKPNFCLLLSWQSWSLLESIPPNLPRSVLNLLHMLKLWASGKAGQISGPKRKFWICLSWKIQKKTIKTKRYLKLRVSRNSWTCWYKEKPQIVKKSLIKFRIQEKILGLFQLENSKENN